MKSSYVVQYRDPDDSYSLWETIELDQRKISSIFKSRDEASRKLLAYIKRCKGSNYRGGLLAPDLKPDNFRIIEWKDSQR